jgi:ankyrin repeat protein
LIYHGADVNKPGDDGLTPLALCVIHDNKALLRILLTNGANIFNTDILTKDKSPFFVAIEHDKQVYLDIFCDLGADTNTLTTNGDNPMLLSVKLGRDDICMYLSLRTKDKEIEDDQGKTIFIHYMLKCDIDRMK